MNCTKTDLGYRCQHRPGECGPELSVEQIDTRPRKAAETAPLVKIEDERPYGKGSGHCFYCPSLIGQPHADDCALYTKTVLVRMVVIYPIEVPNHWGREDIESHRNDGSWCGDNAINELTGLPEDYVCQHSVFTLVEDEK